MYSFDCHDIGPGHHIVWAAIGSGFGLALLEFKRKQLEDVEKLRDRLVMKRMMRLKEEEKKADEE